MKVVTDIYNIIAICQSNHLCLDAYFSQDAQQYTNSQLFSSERTRYNSLTESQFSCDESTYNWIANQQDAHEKSIF